MPDARMPTQDLLIGPSSPASTARELLRTLRDLDLGERVALTRQRTIRIDGCQSRDEPVERGVRYSLRHANDSEETLTIAWKDGALEVQVYGAARWRRVRTPLRVDALGRTSAPELGARLDPRVPRPRAAARFLRRVVRATYA